MVTTPFVRRNGFTLIELLVVVGIIGILVALLMPVLSGVRKKAQAVQCGANLRSIGQALTMYVQQYGYFPAGGGYRPPPSGFYAIWPTRLRGFMGGNRGPFYCPSRDERCRWEPGAIYPPGLKADDPWTHFGYEMGEPLLRTNDVYFSYGYNDQGTGRNNGLGYFVYVTGSPPDTEYGVGSGEVRANLVRSASAMIAIADSNADGWGDTVIDPTLALTHPGDVHEGAANVLYCDGHVERHPQRDLLFGEPYTDERNMRIHAMWNRANGYPQ